MQDVSVQSYPANQAVPNCTIFHPSSVEICHVSVASRLAVASSRPVILAVKVWTNTLNPKLSAQTAGKRIAFGMRVTVGTIGGSGSESITLVGEEEDLVSVAYCSSGRTARKGT